MDKQKQGIVELVGVTLNENQGVIVTGRYFDERYNITDFKIAPRKGLATAEELNQFMQSLRQTDLGQSGVRSAELYDNRLEFGYIAYHGKDQDGIDATVHVNVFPNAILACEGSRASIKIADLTAMYQFRVGQPPKNYDKRVIFDTLE